MLNINTKKTLCDVQEIENAVAPRKLYRKPDLQELGDLRTLTLGGSPGAGDSGGGIGVELPGSSLGGPLLPPEF